MYNKLKRLFAIPLSDLGRRNRHNESYEDLKQQLADCKLFIADQQSRMESLLAEFRTASCLTNDSRDVASGLLNKEMAHEFDAFYMAFEDRFRGSPAEVRKRLEVYVPIVQRVKELAGNVTFLDIGCGRGEWLELVGEYGCNGVGIDTNRVALGRCRELGLNVVEADVLEYMSREDTATYSAVTGFHLVEHLPFEVLMKVIREAFRILQPGGVLIFETPDSENVIVGTSNFYIDPTHRNPLPDKTLAFIAEYNGFTNVEILKLHKIAEPIPTDNSLVNEVQRRFFMSQDYAVIGFKPL